MNRFWTRVLLLLCSAVPYVCAVEIPLEAGAAYKETEAFVFFSYENEDLVNIINQLAQEKRVNILLPQGADEIKAKVTFSLKKQITLAQAWDIVTSILDIAGYSFIPRESSIHIVKNSKNINRESLPVYIGVSPEHLPSSDLRIRSVVYFSNIKMVQGAENEVLALFKTLMPDDAEILVDPVTNSIIVSGKAADIKSFMELAAQLDQVEFQEKIEILKLRNANASIVAQLVSEGILRPTAGQSPYRLDTKKASKVPYFSEHVKIIPEVRTNSLIILGKAQAVERLRDFINDHIDVDLSVDHGSAESILHVYQLQYLDAQEFAPILENIVSSSRPAGGTGQSVAGERQGGTERFFDEVIIKADRPRDAEALNYFGGNKLIIAARNDDWKQIKALIQQLDTPQLQVLIEVLIADLTIDDTRLIGADTRVPDKISLMSDVELQSAHLAPGIMTDSLTNPSTLNSDLLRNGINDAGFRDDNGHHSVASLVASGTTLLSLSDNDGQVWSILEVLKLFEHSKVLSHPHVIATNNKKAIVKVGQTRRLRDEVTSSYSSPTVRLKEVEAALTLELTPRISGDEIVNLQVSVVIDEFIGNTDAQATREVITNANVKSGSILALGGLIRVDNDESTTKFPLFADVPILGYFFKKEQVNVVKNSLTIFISPVIIQPKFRQGLNEHTKEYIDVTNVFSGNGGLFDGLKDPITRWFFKPETYAQNFIKEFIAHDEELADAYNESHGPGFIPEEVDDESPVKFSSVQAPKKNQRDEHFPAESSQQEGKIVADSTEKKLKLRDLLKDDDSPFIT